MKSLILTLVCASVLGVGLSAHPVFALDPVVMDTDVGYAELKGHLLGRYTALIDQLTAGEVANLAALKASSAPNPATAADDATFSPWWQAGVTAPLAALAKTENGQLDQLFAQALQYSSQMKVFADLPLIRRTTIQEADGDFDTRLFAEGSITDIDEPVGDKLRTGGPDRYNEDSTGLAFGLRRKFLPGTEVKLEQQFNRYDNNSEYLDPHDQARTRTGISLTQPLLKGFGPDYNRAPENLAKIDSASANQELRRQMNSHLLEITRSYWGLYMERSIYLQKQRLAEKTEEIFRKMEGRVAIDVQPSLLSRAKSQTLAHRLDADEAKFAILNAQSRLWALVNDPALADPQGLELVTSEQPRHDLPAETMAALLATTLANRPEIDQSINQIQSAALRHYQSINELFPDLHLYAEAYTSGLKGDYDSEEAFQQQWDEGDPSYNVGLRFEFPLANNAAKARAERKKIEIRQLINQLDTTVTNVLLEAQISYREVVKNHMAMARRYAVMKSTEEEISDLISRIDVQLAKSEEYGAILYQLLDALERLNTAELDFSASELTYNLSLYNLQSVKGVLLADNKIQVREDRQDDLPINHLELFDGKPPNRVKAK